MAKFFVGQKVKVVNAILSTNLIGKECRVVRLDAVGFAVDGSRYRGIEVDLTNKFGRQFIAAEGFLEPILPEGHAPSAYSFGELLVKLREGVVV